MSLEEARRTYMEAKLLLGKGIDSPKEKQRCICQTGDAGASSRAVVLRNGTVEVVHERLEVRKVMMVFGFMRREGQRTSCPAMISRSNFCK